MINVKTEEEIQIMRQGGKILASVLWEVLSQAKPSVSELELDELAQKLIRKHGAEPGFQKVPGYKHTICVSTNDVVVHGIPTGYRLKENDVVGIDCGVFYKGFHTDMAETIKVQSLDDDVGRFLETGKRALEEGIKVVRMGNRIGHISKTIQDIVERDGGYSVVRSLVGHGVGRELHEDPEVPGFLRGPIEKTPLLQEGMTIAIEVIYNMGKPDVVYRGNDNWTIVTKDGSLSGVFERTVVIAREGSVVLTA